MSREWRVLSGVLSRRPERATTLSARPRASTGAMIEVRGGRCDHVVRLDTVLPTEHEFERCRRVRESVIETWRWMQGSTCSTRRCSAVKRSAGRGIATPGSSSPGTDKAWILTRVASQVPRASILPGSVCRTSRRLGRGAVRCEREGGRVEHGPYNGCLSAPSAGRGGWEALGEEAAVRGSGRCRGRSQLRP